MEKGLIAWIGVIILLFIITIILAVIPKGEVTGNSINVPLDDPIKIGYSGILSGDYSIWGQSGLAGVELAIKEYNDNEGINGRKIVLVVEDDKASPTESVNAFNKLINIDQVDAILSASGSGATASSVPIAQRAGIPVVVGTASAPTITQTGDYIFRTMPSDTAQGVFAAEFIYNNLKKKKIALIYVKNDWGEGIRNVFKENYKKLGGEIIYETGILEEQADFRTEITKVKQKDVDAIYAPVYPNNALGLFRQINELGLDIQVICGDAIDGDEVIKSPYAEGVIYTVGKISSPEDFVSRINKLKGFENLRPNIAAATSYDAAKALLNAIKKAGTDPEKIKTELEKTSFEGISNPLIEFDENGDLKYPVAEAKIIRDKEAVVYS